MTNYINFYNFFLVALCVHCFFSLVIMSAMIMAVFHDCFPLFPPSLFFSGFVSQLWIFVLWKPQDISLVENVSHVQ